MSRILQPQVGGASVAAQQASIRKQQQARLSSRLPCACRRSAGALKVLDVRIDWHVKRPTSITVKRRAAARAGNEQVGIRAQGSAQADGGLAGLRRQIECMQPQFLRSTRAARREDVVPTPTDPMEFLKSRRDLKAQSAAKEHTNEVRGGGRDPDVRRPGAGLSQSPARSKFFRSAMHALLSF